MKGIIIYKGKYGATAQYAKWMGEDLNFPVYSSVNTSEKKLQESDIVIIGTSVYIGKLQITQWLKINEPILQDKKLFLFLVAGTPPDEKEKLEDYLRSGIPASLRNRITIYFLPGRLVINRLSWKDRFMLKMGAGLTKDPSEKKRMLADYDDVKKENIAAMLADIKKYCLSPVEVEHTV
jgi:menaquinone-dependent protoporphyrinogen IX oxidase